MFGLYTLKYIWSVDHPALHRAKNKYMTSLKISELTQ